jgi:2'-5' RNA ligase
MRLFIAVWPSDDAVAHLDTALDGLRVELPDLRWQPRDRWHLTVAFLGEVEADRLGRVSGTMCDVVGRHGAALDLALAGSGTFGRVLWLGVTPEPPPLAPLARDLARSLRAAGFPLERRPWRPHLTVARARSDTPQLHDARTVLASYQGPRWPAVELTLVRSTPGPAPAYAVVDRLALDG